MHSVYSSTALHYSPNPKNTLYHQTALTPMKTTLTWIFVFALSVMTVSAQLRIGGRTLDTKKLLGAAKDAATALTLSDEDIAKLSHESVEWMDANNPIADENTEYGARLKRLTENITEVNGLKLNFKVYDVEDVNAFACGDGSIRVFSSLMDIMDDDELMAIIGHEIGHVVHADVKQAMKMPTSLPAARGIVSSTEAWPPNYPTRNSEMWSRRLPTHNSPKAKSTKPMIMACNSASNMDSTLRYGPFSGKTRRAVKR